MSQVKWRGTWTDRHGLRHGVSLWSNSRPEGMWTIDCGYWSPEGQFIRGEHVDKERDDPTCLGCLTRPSI